MRFNSRNRNKNQSQHKSCLLSSKPLFMTAVSGWARSRREVHLKAPINKFYPNSATHEEGGQTPAMSVS